MEFGWKENIVLVSSIMYGESKHGLYSNQVFLEQLFTAPRYSFINHQLHFNSIEWNAEAADN